MAGPKQDYPVGYGKPPRKTRFKAGKSGNPNGRPRGSKNFRTELGEELHETISLREDGQPKRISKQRAVVKSLILQAVQGNVSAANAVLSAISKYIPDTDVADASADLNSDEHQVLDTLKRRFTPSEKTENELKGAPKRKRPRLPPHMA